MEYYNSPYPEEDLSKYGKGFWTKFKESQTFPLMIGIVLGMVILSGVFYYASNKGWLKTEVTCGNCEKTECPSCNCPVVSVNNNCPMCPNIQFPSTFKIQYVNSS